MNSNALFQTVSFFVMLSCALLFPLSLFVILKGIGLSTVKAVTVVAIQQLICTLIVIRKRQ